MKGIVGAVHSVPEDVYKYGGSFGIIVGEDRKLYVYSVSHVYRDGSHLENGSTVTFEPFGHSSYATNITTRDYRHGR